jgi:hypothetical protein
MSIRLGRKISYVDVTDDQAADSMRAAGMTELGVRAMIEFMQAARDGYLGAVGEDVERVLGRKAISFDQFLKDHLEAFGPAGLFQFGHRLKQRPRPRSRRSK